MRLVGVSLVCACVGAGIVSCSSGEKAEANYLRVGNGAEVQALDPHLVVGVTEHRVLSSLFEGLADVDPATLEAVPAAASSWLVSEDQLTYTFTLREGARWSNGDALTAEDFVYSWRRMLSPGLGAEYAYMLHCLKNARPFNEGKLDDFAEVGARALDERTLEVRLDHPTPYFLNMQIHFAWYPVHRETIEQFGKIDERGTQWTAPGNMVSNGPFLLKEWLPNEYIVVEKNPHYWDAAHVRLDGIQFFPIDNEQTEERSFRQGDLHITSTIPLHRIQVYRKENPDVLHIDPYLGTYFYRLNTTRPPFDDVRVRRAFSMALDREELAKNVLKGTEQPAYCFTPPGAAGYASSAQVPYAVEQARALLAEAGYPGGQGLPPIEILYNTAESHKTIAEAIQRMWKQSLNADVQLSNQDWKVYLDTMNALDYSVARSAWIADVVDPVNFLECFLTDSGNNRTGFSNEKYDAAVRQAYQERDPAKRYEILRQAEAILLDESPIVPIYFYTWKYLMAPEVKGHVPNIQGYFRWKDMYLAE